MEFLFIKKIKEINKLSKKKKIYFLSGGTDLMVQYKEDLLDSKSIIADINRINTLNYINKNKKNIKIGSLSTFTDILKNKSIINNYKTLFDAVSSIGSLQIRNRATIGGNIGNASPAGDSIPALYVYDAKIKTNLNKYSIKKLFTGAKKTSLKNGELITEIILPESNKKYKSYFFKGASREALAISKATLAVRILWDKNIIKDIKIAAGAVGITVIKAVKTENFLKNKKITDSIINEAKDIIKNEIKPIDDFRSTKLYRSVFIQESLQKCLVK